MRLTSLFMPLAPVIEEVLQQRTLSLVPTIKVEPPPVADPPPFEDKGPRAPEPKRPGFLRRAWRYAATGVGFMRTMPKAPLFERSHVVPPTSGNSIHLMVDGKDFRQNLVKQLNAAKASVWINFYLFDIDTDGAVQRALEAALVRGVRVRIVADNRDGARSYVDPSVHQNASIDALKALGADVVRSSTKNLGINHRKIAVFDGHRAMVVGYNFTDKYMKDAPNGTDSYHDSGVLLSGPAVRDIAHVFAASWRDATGQTLDLPPRLTARQGPFSDATVELLRHDKQADKNVEVEVIAQIRNAKKRIRLANPNAMTNNIVDALKEAAGRGVQVEWVWGPQRTAYENVIANNTVSKLIPTAKVYQYPHLLHVKAYSFDDSVSIVGSSNLDSFAIYQNDELSLKITSSAFAQELGRRVFDTDEAKSALLTQTPRVTTGSASKDWLARGIEPLLNRR